MPPSPATAPARRRAPAPPAATWRVALALALPFLVMVAALQGLTATLPTFHGSDEAVYHLPTIERFARDLPAVDLVHYPAAQTPLFHLAAAAWGKLVGLELWRLRLLEVAISYAAVLVLWVTLRRHRGFAPWPAAALALLLAGSPYVFGASFILMTDNLGLLLCLLAVERLLAFARDAGAPAVGAHRGAPPATVAPRLRWGAFAAACGWIGLALLTRQSYVWLAPLALAVALLAVAPRVRRAGSPRRWLAAGRALAPAGASLALALAPTVALVVAWRGLVPPDGDPASCGLCAPAEGRPGWQASSPLRAPLLAVAVLGLYGPLLLGRAFAGEVAGWLRRGAARVPTAGPAGWRAPALGALAGAALLLLVPLAPGTGRGDDGYLWRIARAAPELLGTSLPFWALVPLGGAVLALWVRRDGWRALPLLLLGCFATVQLATRLPYQKYVDPFVLLALLLAVRPAWLARPRDWLGPALVGLLSLAYLLAFAVGAVDAA